MANGEGGGMKRLCDWYVRRVALIGFLYCAVPTLVGFGWLLLTRPFREVYLARLAIALVVGGGLAAWINRFGVSLWVIKHRSKAGPATVLDGALIGVATGWASALVPPLTGLLYTSGSQLTLVLIIAAWLAAAVVGAMVGAILASVGRKHLGREEAAA
jgi:hypothetical protein